MNSDVASTNQLSNPIATTKHAIIIVLASIMPAMAIISLVPVLPLLMKEFSDVKGYQFLVPIAMTIPALCVAVFSPLAGWISDKFGRKSVLIISLLVYAGIGLLPYFLTNLFHIIGARVILGIAEAAIMTVATALIADYFTGKERQRWITIQIACVSLSAIVLIAVGGLLGEFFGSRGPFFLYLLAFPIALAGAIVLFEPTIKQATSSVKELNLPWGKILPLIAITLFVGIIFYTVIVKLGDILALTMAVSPAIIGGIGAAANIGVAVGSISFNKFKGASAPKLITIGLSLSTIGYFVAAVSSTILLTSAALVIACLGFGLLLPTMLNWILRELPENVRGRGTGLWTGAFFMGQFFAPIAVAALQAKLGGLPNVLMLIAVMCAIGIVFAVLKLKGAQTLVNK